MLADIVKCCRTRTIFIFSVCLFVCWFRVAARQRIKIFSISSFFVCTWQHNLQSLSLYQCSKDSWRFFYNYTAECVGESVFVETRRLILLLIILYYCHSFGCHWHKLPQLTTTINNSNNTTAINNGGIVSECFRSHVFALTSFE